MSEAWAKEKTKEAFYLFFHDLVQNTLHCLTQGDYLLSFNLWKHIRKAFAVPRVTQYQFGVKEITSSLFSPQ